MHSCPRCISCLHAPLSPTFANVCPGGFSTIVCEVSLERYQMCSFCRASCPAWDRAWHPVTCMA